MNDIKFIFPIDGACINERDGISTENGIIIPVKVKAPKGSAIYICGKKAEYKNDIFMSEVTICGYRNTLTAKDMISGSETVIAVYYFSEATGKFRVSSDDNIIFLQDITKNKDFYSSIFDNPYLSIYKKAHDLYGAKVHLNLFYEFHPEERNRFSDKSRKYFDLSMMTDKFKDEFRANSDWLKLAFHSNSELPDAPYKNATAEQITADCVKICREIIRFAGAECISDSTTVHYGAVNKEGVRALRALGFKSLTGYFERSGDGRPLVAYYTDGEILDHIGGRDFWYDTQEDMIFAKIDSVLNTGSFEQVMASVKNAVSDPHRGGFVSVMIHEQYFHKDYVRHLPDFEARVLETCKYISQNGYKGAHMSEVTRRQYLRENPLFK